MSKDFEKTYFFTIVISRCTLIQPGITATNFNSSMTGATEELAKVADEKSKQLLKTFRNSFLPENIVPTGWNQPVDEVAQIVKDAVLAENPDFRYQTTEAFKKEAAKKFTDPTGDSNVRKVHERYFKWQKKL